MISFQLRLVLLPMLTIIILEEFNRTGLSAVHEVVAHARGWSLTGKLGVLSYPSWLCSRRQVILANRNVAANRLRRDYSLTLLDCSFPANRESQPAVSISTPKASPPRRLTSVRLRFT